jgi:hypothetical protein
VNTATAPREYRATTVSYYLSIAAMVTWLPVLVLEPWTKLVYPAVMVIPSMVALRLAFATRRRVKQGLETPPQWGQLGLTFSFSVFHIVLGLPALLFLLFIGLWFLTFVKGVGH